MVVSPLPLFPILVLGSWVEPLGQTCRAPVHGKGAGSPRPSSTHSARLWARPYARCWGSERKASPPPQGSRSAPPRARQIPTITRTENVERPRSVPPRACSVNGGAPGKGNPAMYSRGAVWWVSRGAWLKDSPHPCSAPATLPAPGLGPDFLPHPPHAVLRSGHQGAGWSLQKP